MFDWITYLDIITEQLVFSLRQPALTLFFEIMTHLGGFLVVVCLSAVVAYFLLQKDKNMAKLFVIALFANEVLVYLLKNIIGRLRPFGALRYGEFDASMPSGHAAIAIFFYGFLIYLVRRYYRSGAYRLAIVSLLLALVLVIGMSRLYLDVHYLTDVLAGYLLGGAVLYYLVKRLDSR